MKMPVMGMVGLLSIEVIGELMKKEEKNRDDKKRGEEGMIGWITFGNPEDMTFPILCRCSCYM